MSIVDIILFDKNKISSSHYLNSPKAPSLEEFGLIKNLIYEAGGLEENLTLIFLL